VLSGEFRLIILIISKAVSKTIDRNQGIVNSVEQLKVAARQTVRRLRK
jgi:hypothetical protein